MPEFDDELGGYVVTCRVSQCAAAKVVYVSGSQTAAHAMARSLVDKGVYRASLCPYECTRKVTLHGLDHDEESSVRDGVGSPTAGLQYLGYKDDPVLGLATYAKKAAASEFSETAKTIHRQSGLTIEQCSKEVHDHKLLAMHGLWVYNHTTSLDARVGECAFYLAARSTLQLNVWKAFFSYAQEILDLGHVREVDPTELVAAVAAPSEVEVCDPQTSKVCMLWSEFDLDHSSEIGCFPASDGSNVATPTVMMQELGENGIKYPPPAPPPPEPPYAPAIPDLPIVPGGAFVCNPKSLPSATFVRDHSLLHANPPSPPSGTAVGILDPVNVANKQVVCWRWDEAGLWPPVSSHQDAYEEQEVCGGISSREVRWEDDFRQSKLHDIYRSRLNDDTCRSANDGICQDGGYGDARPGRTDFHWASPAFSLISVTGTHSRWKFNGMEAHHQAPAVGQTVYVHALEQASNSAACFQTNSHCTESAFVSTNFGTSRPGRLIVIEQGTEDFNVGTTVTQRPYFIAESAGANDDPSRNAITCNPTSTAACPNSGSGICNSDFALTTSPCSQNMWATGASDPGNCPYGTE